MLQNLLAAKIARSKMAGFSLIEILVVVVIIGVLAVAVVPSLLSRPDEARVARATQDVNTIMTMLEVYYNDNGMFPTQEQGLKALVIEPTMPPLPRNWSAAGYLRSLPEDPWGRPYQYRNPGVHGMVDVFSLGADGREGGEGVDAEIGNWR